MTMKKYALVLLLVGCVAANSFAIRKEHVWSPVFPLPATIFNQALAFLTEHPNSNSIESKSFEYFKYAIRLNIPVELVDDLNLFRFLFDWYGTRYLFGGMTKKGIDCSAFIQRLMKDVYCVNMSRVAGSQFKECTEIKKSDLRQGDLVFFHTTLPGISHVGFYLGNNKFIHASVNKGISVDDLTNSYYKKAYRSSGRILLN